MSFWNDVLLKHLQSQLDADELAVIGGSKLFEMLTRAEFNESIMNTYTGTKENAKTLHTRFDVLRAVLMWAGVLLDSRPLVLQPEQMRVVRVVFPRICHAVLFAADLLVNGIFLQPDSRGDVWSQICWSRGDEGVLEEKQIALNNPCYFLDKHDFCLVKRYCEPPPFSRLHAFARDWGDFCVRSKIPLPDPTRFPYVAEFDDMTLFEVCFYTCFEYAARWIDIERDAASQRPTKWSVPNTFTEAEVESVQRCFPSFFWSADSEPIWNACLCHFGRQHANLSAAWKPWELGLSTAAYFEDYRLNIRSEDACWTNWKQELGAYSRAAQ
jgi:hypothetical protein